jgi:DNA mismatch repair protein MSH5
VGSFTQYDMQQLRGSRHPLQELVDDRFVANDTFAVGATARSHPAVEETADDVLTDAASSPGSVDIQARRGNAIVICTGANASGKSVYLKQCILIPYLAQVIQNIHGILV